MPKTVRGVMREFQARQLHSGAPAGPIVTNRAQAVAIALSEQRAMQRALHPALKARAVAVKIAHAHLSRHMPGFRALPGAEQFIHTQRHVSAQRRKA